MKSERIDLFVPAWLKQAIKNAAAKKGITMSEFIKDALKEAVKGEV